MNKNNEIAKIQGYSVLYLSRKFAKQHIDTLTKMINQIPLVDYTPEIILAESKGERIFFGRWDHSFVLVDNDRPIACILGYERKSEENTPYQKNTIYISELAVDKRYQRQGLAKELLKIFLKQNDRLLYLQGKVHFSVQTNESLGNSHVQNLYKSFGFITIGKKEYDNRTDVVLMKD